METIDYCRGYWNETVPNTHFPRLADEQGVDVAIVGGGIVGVTTARFLKDSGFTVAVVEALKVGQQVTGQSTAKITSQHGLLYQSLEKTFGQDYARLYGEAQEAGVHLMGSFVDRYQISCDLEARSAFIYTQDHDHVPSIEEEADICRRLGLPASLVYARGLPFEVLAAIRYDQQMQFHPTAYIAELARTVPGDGSHVFENSRVIDWGPARVVTTQGSINARHMVMATHLPLGQTGGYYGRAFPNAEPVIVARLDQDIDGMHLSAEEPGYSIRTHRHDNGNLYAVAAGGTFKPGRPEEEQRHFDDVEGWLKKHFAAGPVEYRWVNEGSSD